MSDLTLTSTYYASTSSSRPSSSSSTSSASSTSGSLEIIETNKIPSGVRTKVIDVLNSCDSGIEKPEALVTCLLKIYSKKDFGEFALNLLGGFIKSYNQFVINEKLEKNVVKFLSCFSNIAREWDNIKIALNQLALINLTKQDINKLVEALDDVFNKIYNALKNKNLSAIYTEIVANENETKEQKAYREYRIALSSAVTSIITIGMLQAAQKMHELFRSKIKVDKRLQLDDICSELRNIIAQDSMDLATKCFVRLLLDDYQAIKTALQKESVSIVISGSLDSIAAITMQSTPIKLSTWQEYAQDIDNIINKVNDKFINFCKSIQQALPTEFNKLVEEKIKESSKNTQFVQQLDADINFLFSIKLEDSRTRAIKLAKEFEDKIVKEWQQKQAMTLRESVKVKYASSFMWDKFFLRKYLQILRLRLNNTESMLMQMIKSLEINGLPIQRYRELSEHEVILTKRKQEIDSSCDALRLEIKNSEIRLKQVDALDPDWLLQQLLQEITCINELEIGCIDQVSKCHYMLHRLRLQDNYDLYVNSIGDFLYNFISYTEKQVNDYSKENLIKYLDDQIKMCTQKFAPITREHIATFLNDAKNYPVETWKKWIDEIKKHQLVIINIQQNNQQSKQSLLFSTASIQGVTGGIITTGQEQFQLSQHPSSATQTANVKQKKY